MGEKAYFQGLLMLVSGLLIGIFWGLPKLAEKLGELGVFRVAIGT